MMPSSETITTAQTEARRPSAWSPLAQPLFRALWLAAVASNVGTWMHNVGADWLMTALAPSPLMVGLMQTAENAPLFLLALPAGALADIVDRRRLLLFTQAWMLVSAVVLGLLTFFGLTTPAILLLLIFSLGLGSALNAPAWQAIVPELVPRAELSAAVALNSVAFNIARAVGPALGGFVVAAVGSWAVFLLNSLSLAIYLLVFFGGMALGSAFWGAVANRIGISAALLYAAAALIVGLAAAYFFPLRVSEGLDLEPSLHWSEPTVVTEFDPQAGPVLVTVDYQIAPERAGEFVAVMQEWKRILRRDGAVRWGLFADPAQPGHYVETFLVESWAEHMRQHARVTNEDRAVQDRIRSFHLEDADPVVTHLIAQDFSK
jgi:hypothetical protein